MPVTVFSAGQATKYRTRVLGLLCLLWIITYLDRVCISVAGPRIQEALQIGPVGWRKNPDLGCIANSWLSDEQRKSEDPRHTVSCRKRMTTCSLIRIRQTWSLSLFMRPGGLIVNFRE
jgi:hypothetical protein